MKRQLIGSVLLLVVFISYHFIAQASTQVSQSDSPQQATTVAISETPPSTTVTPTPQPITLKVQYMTTATIATTNQIKAQFKIVNNTSNPIGLSALTLRYYFTIDSASDLIFTCDYALFGCNNIVAQFVSVTPAVTGADYYLQLSFTSAAGNLSAFATSGAIQTRINKANWSNFNQSNDYSYDATKTAFTDWNKVTLYRSSTLAWGAEPLSPTPTSTALIPTNTASPTVTPSLTPDPYVTVFSDDFSTDPSTNGRWRIYRHSLDTINEVSWDTTNKVVYLTRAMNDKIGAMYADYELTSRDWVAQFRYRAGGGTGADGISFLFYRDETFYSQNKVWAGLPDGGCPEAGIFPGYNIEFDNYPYNCGDPGQDNIALNWNGNGNSLTYTFDNRVEDNLWHDVVVQFNQGHVTVKVDNQTVIDYTIASPDYTYKGIGFVAATGGENHNHLIDDFVLKVASGSVPTSTMTTTTPTPTNTRTLTPTITLTPTQTATPTPVVLTVTKLQDTNDGVCSSTDCSLREAISTAPSGATINFQPGLTGIIYLGAEIYIQKVITIVGPGANILTISGNNSTRLFHLYGAQYSLTISGLTFANGTVAGAGGAIFTYGSNVTISDSVFRNNTALLGGSDYWPGYGGAVAGDSGNLKITSSTFEGNSADTSGGAIATMGTTVTVANSVIYKNNATQQGGAIYIYAYQPGYFILANSTVTGNSTTYGTGSAIYNLRLSPPDGPNTHGFIINSTIVGNKGGVSGTTLKNTIIADNAGWNCIDGTADGGNNLQYPYTDCGSTIRVAAPKLGTFQNNGGTTWTMALQPGSPAIDAGNNAFCSSSPVNNRDQRGTTRLVDGNADGTATCDIGAYEAPASISTQPTLTPTATFAPKTLVVTKFEDTDDWICDSDCSLREALKVADDGDSITFAPQITGTLPANSEYAVHRSVTIAGPGVDVLAIAPTHSGRAFVISPGVRLSISEITIRGVYGGYAPSMGIYNNNATLELNRVRLVDIASNTNTNTGYGMASRVSAMQLQLLREAPLQA